MMGDFPKAMLSLAILLWSISIANLQEKDLAYPHSLYSGERTSWCKGKYFNQTINRKGCKTRYIQNKMCIGECLSYYLPRRNHNEVACFACRPYEKETKPVLFNCSGDQGRTIQMAFVQIVLECKCMLLDL